MEKYYLFQATQDFDHDLFSSLLEGIAPGLEVVYEDGGHGYFLGDETLSSILSQKAFDLHLSLGVRFNILVSHKICELSTRLRRDALDYFPNQCVYLSDVLFKEMSFGDYGAMRFLKAEFEDVPDEILETIGQFLRCNLNGLDTAKAMGIHRNTFNYRLAQFIQKTGLDPRDYHNALLLELYFQFIRKD